MVGEKFITLVDHCEMDHEFEVAPGTTFEQLRAMHADRHRMGDHWNHTHWRGQVRYKEAW